MKVYKIVLSVIDFDGLGAEGIKDELEHTRFANDCISPSVVEIKGVDIGEWDDDSPLNKRATHDAEFNRLFADR